MSHVDDDPTRALDDDQRLDARRMIDQGWSLRDIADRCGLTLPGLQRKLGLPQWRDESQADESME